MDTLLTLAIDFVILTLALEIIAKILVGAIGL